MQKKHTSGPWTLYKSRGGSHRIHSDDERALKIHDGRIGQCPNRKGEGEGNALIMAHSLDLLEACEELFLKLAHLREHAPNLIADLDDLFLAELSTIAQTVRLSRGEE